MAPLTSATTTSGSCGFPLQDLAILDDIFECSICADLILEPLTLSCCGKSFCRSCLRNCLEMGAKQEFVPSCPSGCGNKMPLPLPAVNHMLQQVIQVLRPQDLARRRKERDESSDEIATPYGVLVSSGFEIGQEVAAAHQLHIKHRTVAHLGSRAVVLAGDLVAGRITVKFHERLDGRSECVHVLPLQIVPQLPASCGVSVGQRVLAAMNLYVGSTAIVWRGTEGVVECLTPDMLELRLTVQFSQRADGSSSKVNVTPMEITPFCILAGGFWPMQKVQAATDLYAGGKKIVRAGIPGIICARFSETRFSVKFDDREDGSDAMVNVTPEEVRLCPQSRKLVLVPKRPYKWPEYITLFIYGCSIACMAMLLKRLKK